MIVQPPGFTQRVIGGDGGLVFMGGPAGGGGETGGFFIADAETGNTSQFTSVTQNGAATFTASPGAAIHGGYGFAPTGDGANYAYGTKTFAAVPVVFARFYIFVPSTWTELADFNYTYIMALNSGASIRARVYLQQQPGGLIQLHGQLNSGAFSNFGTSSIAKNAVHYVEIQFVANATTGGIQFWVDGVSQGAAFTQNTGGQNIDTVVFGMLSQNPFSSGASVALDDLKLAATGPIGAYAA